MILASVKVASEKLVRTDSQVGYGPLDSVGDHRRLGEFTLLSEVGRGGMGVVYEAQQASLYRRVAIKLLHRRVGLIANGDIKPQPNSVRDSILAAMAAEHSSLSVALPEQTPARLPSLACPGVAIVVSTLAMAGRYRRNAKLESSS